MNASVTRGLSVGGDERALTTRRLNDTVAQTFKKKNIYFGGSMPLIKWTDLGNGESSHDYPIMGEGDGEATEFAPGAFRDGNDIPMGNVNVVVDDPIEYPVRLPLRDDQLSKWPLIAPHATEAGRKVAEKADIRAIVTHINAARTAADGVIDGGHTIEVTGVASLAAAFPVSSAGAEALVKNFADMARKYDEADIPEENRIAVIDPYLREVFTRSDRYVSRDYVRENFGAVHDRQIGAVEGWQLVMTNRIPSTNLTTDSLAKYQVDARRDGAVGQPVALFSYMDEDRFAIGGARVAGMSTEITWDSNRQCWLILPRIFAGLGKVYPFCAGELRITD